MPFSQVGPVKFYQFDLLSEVGVRQAVFSRHGGVSEGPWHSLNVGKTVGDDEAKVTRNRELAFEAAGRDIQSLSDSWLMHGADVIVYDRPRPVEQLIPPKADIILTDKPEVSLFMRYADCAPILLVDPVRRALGLAHAGWRGAVQKVAARAVEAMTARYGSRPGDLLAAVGPAIGPARYEVGPEVAAEVQAAFGPRAGELLPRFGESTHFDLWAANRLALEEAGVKEIEVAGICTAENNRDWFSHRADKGRTGRFGVLLALEE